MIESKICPHSKDCPGCSTWETPLNSQIDQKKQIVYNHLNKFVSQKSSSGSTKLSINIESLASIECHSVGSGFHRVWFDLQFSANGLGLINKDREICPIKTCYLLSEPLQVLLNQLNNLKFPNKKISARLRVSPQNAFGLWLDMANIDVKELLQEKSFLYSLSQIAPTIEIGQKRKILDLHVPENQQYKLKDPELKPWFQTLGEPLFCAVGSFTQPSWKSADMITTQILKWSTGKHSVTEFGSGAGQYTRPLLKNKSYVTVYENNPLAIDALKFNTKDFADILIINPKTVASSELYLVNPPRSGLGAFTEQILNSKVSQVIYISCSIESLAADLEKLSTGYAIKDLILVDQFPNSKHFETCVLLERRS